MAKKANGKTNEETTRDEPGEPTQWGMAAMINAPALETVEDVADYLAGDFMVLCRMATDLANAGVALPGMFYEDLGTLACYAAEVLRGEGATGGEANEPLEYLKPLSASYAGLARKLEEGSGGPASFTMADGLAGEVCSTTMPMLSRLIQGAAVQAEEEWAARHENAI